MAQSAGELDTVCQTVDMGGTRLLKLKDPYTRTLPIELPAGTVDITRARAWDAYTGRSTAGVQTSERYEIEFLDSAGNVVATSAPTGDVPDGLEEAEWVGPLGEVQLPVAVAGIRAHHRNDLPADDTPDSVNAGDFTVCYTVTTTPETTTPETTVPETTVPETTVPETTDGTESTTAPTEPTTVGTDPAGPIVQTPSTVAPTTPTTATPTTPAPTTATTVKAQAGTTLPVTGSATWLIVLGGTTLLCLGWGLRQVAGHLE